MFQKASQQRHKLLPSLLYSASLKLLGICAELFSHLPAFSGKGLAAYKIVDIIIAIDLTFNLLI